MLDIRQDSMSSHEMLDLLKSGVDLFAQGDYLAAEKILRRVFAKDDMLNTSPVDAQSYLEASICFTKILLKKQAQQEALTFISQRAFFYPRDEKLFLALWEALKDLEDIEIITILTTIYQEADYAFVSDMLAREERGKIYLYFQKKSAKKEGFLSACEYIAADRKDVALALLGDDLKRILKLQNKIASKKYTFPTTLEGIFQQTSK